MKQICKNIASMMLAPLRERGAIETARSVMICAYSVRRERLEGFDRRFGTDTSRHFRWSDLAAAGDDAMTLWRYWPTPEEPFRRMMSALAVNHENSVFVDLGSGKGRALLLASDWPWQRICGVELSPALNEVARANITRYHSPRQRCNQFELQQVDAAEFVPPMEPPVFYLFQPFPLAVLEGFLGNLSRSLEMKERPCEIAYLNPLFGQAILATGLFEQTYWGAPTRKGEFAWAIYSHRPGR